MEGKRKTNKIKHRQGELGVVVGSFKSQTQPCADSPSARLFAVGARARHPPQPLALLAQRVLVVHQADAQVGQIAGVQGGVGAQLPLSRVWLFLYPNVWGGEKSFRSERTFDSSFAWRGEQQLPVRGQPNRATFYCHTGHVTSKRSNSMND